ncbi:hypothetical protein [Bacillus smithii]|uniref:hypothetical protein n=1 Tax=Bacillus smithii TaxID=1479 RepID=UPI003D1FECDC
MLDDPILRRQEGESFNRYHIRLYEKKNEYGLSREEIADLLNKEYGSNYDESKWRKDYAAYVKWKDFIIAENLNEDIVKKYEELKIEAEKEKVRQRDQKREYRNLIRNSARFEKIKDDIYEAILQLEKKKPLKFNNENRSFEFSEERHGLALFSDWHFGMEVDNTINKYNKEVFNERVTKLANKIITYGKFNKISTLHVAQLGDLLSGMIHVSTRVQSNEDIIEQIQYVSETLAEILVKLASEFNQIHFYNVIGNHGRIGKKDDVGIKENFEYLVPWYLEARLRNIPNIKIVSDNDGYITTNIFDTKIVFVHGNFDRIDQSVTKLPQLLGYVPDMIIGGHIHHNYENEYGKTTVLTNGSLIGVDDFAMQGRHVAKPSQKFMVFDKEEGLESTYSIKL